MRGVSETRNVMGPPPYGQLAGSSTPSEQHQIEAPEQRPRRDEDPADHAGRRVPGENENDHAGNHDEAAEYHSSGTAWSERHAANPTARQSGRCRGPPRWSA